MTDKISKLPVQAVYQLETLMLRELVEVIEDDKYSGMSIATLIGMLESVKALHLESFLEENGYRE